MFNISIYLDKFKKIEVKSSNLKNHIIDSINNIIKINIDKKDVELKNGVVYLRVHPVVKNEIFINKNTILKELNTKKIPISGIF